jgi:hypothetical protein
MPGLVLRPTATVNASAGTKVGGATAHAVLGDANNASWIEMWPEAGVARVTLATPTKGADQVTRYIRPVCAVASISINSTKFDLGLEQSGVVVSSLTGVQISGTDVEWHAPGWIQPGDLSAAQIAALALTIRRSATGAVTNLRAIDLWLDVVFADPPTVSASASMSGTTTTVNWTPANGADGGSYRWSQVWLTDPNGTTIYDSGVTDNSALLSRAIGGLAIPGTYTWHVRVAHEDIPGNGHWSATTTATAVLPVQTRAEVLAVTPVPDHENIVAVVTVTRDTAKDAWGTVELQRLSGVDLLSAVGNIETGTGGIATGWKRNPIQNPAVTQTDTIETASGVSGNYQQFAGTAPAGSFAQLVTEHAYPVQPGETIEVTAWTRTTVSGTAEARFVAAWLSGAPGLGRNWNEPGNSHSVTTILSTGAWSLNRYSWTAPPSATAFMLSAEIYGGAGGGNFTFAFDLVTAIPGAWVSLVVPIPATNSVDVTDRTILPYRPTVYRARAIKTDLVTVGSWVYSSAVTVAPTVTGVRISPLLRPDLTATFDMVGYPTAGLSIGRTLYPVMGSDEPVAREDTRLRDAGELVLRCRSDADETSLRAALSAGTALVVAPTSFQLEAGYYSFGQVTRVNYGDQPYHTTRDFRIEYNKVTL